MREGDAHHLVRPDPARIIVPRRHGEVLVEPGLAALRGAVTVGGGFAGQVRWDDLAGMRAAARQAAAQQVRAFAERSGLAPPSGDMAARAWVVTGHQLEFYHAGVWAKVLATDALARGAGAVGIDVLVDHDVVDELGFEVPARTDDGWVRRSVTWGVPRQVAADGLAAPTRGEFEAWEAALARRLRRGRIAWGG